MDSKILVLGAGSIGLAAYLVSRLSQSKNLSAKFKLNPLVPNSVNYSNMQLNVNFPAEVINQSSFDVTLKNLFLNVSYQDATGQWMDLMIQRNAINQVNFKPGVPTRLNNIPLSISITELPTLLKIIKGTMSRKLLVSTRFEVAGIEIDPIQTEIDANVYLAPITAGLRKFGLLAGTDFKPGINLGYSKNFHYREIRSGNEFNSLMPIPVGKEKEIRKNGTAYDTIDDMAQIVATKNHQTQKLAEFLKGSTKEQSVRNVYNFLYNHIQYKQDAEGIEQLREPAVSWSDRKSGIDCDCFSIFASCLLTNLGIDHYIEMCAISPDPWFKHVYVIVPKKSNTDTSSRENYWVVDACLHKFDQLAPNIIQKYSRFMRTVQLSGLDSCMCKTQPQTGTFGKKPVNKSVKPGSKPVTQSVKPAVNVVITDSKLNEMQLEILKPLKETLIKTRAQAISNPNSVALLYKPQTLVKAIDHALANWQDARAREKALDTLAKQDEVLSNKTAIKGLYGMGAFAGLGGVDFDPTRVYPVFGLDGLGNLQVTELSGLFDSIKKTAQSVKTAVTNVAKKAVETVKQAPAAVKQATSTAANAVKNAAKFVANNAVKILPIAIVARTAYRGLVALNFRGHATQMAQAMTTEAGTKKLKDFWTSPFVGGNWGDLVSAINAGKSKKALLAGFDGLGEPVTVAASVASSTPILVKIADVIKDALSVSGKVAKATEAVQKVTTSVNQVKTLVDSGKSLVQTVIPKQTTSSNQPVVYNQVQNMPGIEEQIQIPSIDPGVRPNQSQNVATNPSKSNTGLLLGIGAAIIAGIAYAMSGNSSSKPMDGTPEFVI
jgi:hypothetical protein